MFRWFRRMAKRYGEFLCDSYDPKKKPTVYKLGNKRYIKVKRLNRSKGQRGPYIK